MLLNRPLWEGSTSLSLFLSHSLAFGFLGALAACSAPENSQEVNETISRLESGSLVADIERAMEELPAKRDFRVTRLNDDDTLDPISNPAAAVAPTSYPYPTVQSLNVKDHCEAVPKPAAQASDEDMKKAAESLGACMREIMMPAYVMEGALSHLRRFELDAKDRVALGLASAPAPSDASDTVSAPATNPAASSGNSAEDLKTPYYGMASFVTNNRDSNLLTMTMPADKQAKLRSGYDDQALKDLDLLSGKLRAYLLEAEKLIFAAMDERKALLSHIGARYDRYRMLLALRATHGDDAGVTTGRTILKYLGSSTWQTADVSGMTPEYLHPYALYALVPGKGLASSSLDPRSENPFQYTLNAMVKMGGDLTLRESRIDTYKTLRDLNNPTVTSTYEPAPGAVKVAVIDSGIDTTRFADLGTFLSTSSANGRLESKDYAAGDSNPWAPFMSGFSHGTGTAATVLTVLAQSNREIFEERKIDFAFWKLATLKKTLSGVSRGGETVWGSRAVPHIDAIFDQLTSKATKADVVSVSLGFKTDAFLQMINQPNLLKQNTNWLWVMAAGNDGSKVESAQTSCFSDVELARRPKDHILCVGALKRGIVRDEIAKYSNHGDLVDLYSYESFTRLCPNGTSCSTPAIAAAAAALKAKYPALKPNEIKSILVAASSVRMLPVESEQGGLDLFPNPNGPEVRKVRVFDPTTRDLDKAMALAAQVVGGTATVSEPVLLASP